MERRVTCFQPDLRLLRHPYICISTANSSTPRTATNVWSDVDQSVDRDMAEDAMCNDALPSEQSYQAALLLDAMRFVPAGLPSTVHYYLYARMDRVACTGTLPPLTSKITDIAFLRSIYDVKDPLIKLLNKTIPQRCMIRKFGKVAIDAFRSSEETTAVVRQMMLVSLLGNYEHARPSSRPTREGREILYALLDGYGRRENWVSSFFFRMFHLCSDLIAFGLREYLVWALDDVPAMRSHFDTFSDYNGFRGVVVQCMDEVRAFFATHLCNRASPLFAALQRSASFQCECPLLDADAMLLEAHFFEQLNTNILDRYHERMLEKSYKRPNTTLVSILRTVRKMIPMVERPDYVPSVQRAGADEDDDDMDEEDDDADAEDGDADEEKIAHRRRPRKRAKKSSEDAKQQTAFDLRPYVPPKQQEALSKMVDRALLVSTSPSQALVASLDMLQCCGVSSDVTEDVKRVVKDIQTGSVSTKQYTTQLRLLQTKFPHAYNLVQATAEMVREKQRIRVVMDLPFHFTRNQIASIRQRFGLREDSLGLPESAVYFVYCPVCNRVYSLLRDFDSSYVNNYGYGLRDAVVSYETNRLYCFRKKVNHRGSCASQELVRICLLGKLLYFCGKAILLCPQPGCGMPMVLSSRECVWNEHGPSCYDCSFRLRMKRLDYRIDFMTRCARCGIELTRPDGIYLYPHGVSLCHRHHSQYPQLASILQTPEYAIRCVDRASTVRQIAEYYSLRRRERSKSNENYNKWVLKRSKMNTRSRKR
jgi:hypothetical protein